jgi:hypothetical protein
MVGGASAGVQKDPGSLGSARDDTRKKAKKKSEAAQVHLESQHPHLPAAAPAGRLSRKVTGEVLEAAAAGQEDTKKEPGFFATATFALNDTKTAQRRNGRNREIGFRPEMSSNRDPTSTQGKLRPASFLSSMVQGLALPKEV